METHGDKDLELISGALSSARALQEKYRVDLEGPKITRASENRSSTDCLELKKNLEAVIVDSMCCG